MKRSFHLAALATTMLLGCAWQPYVPKTPEPPPPDRARLAPDLALGAIHSATLDCRAGDCNVRYRLVIEEAGSLEVAAHASLETEDERMRMVVESARSGVVARRGAREDPFAVVVDVEPGVYFVLLQAVGGSVPYELRAELTPSGAAPPRDEVAAQPVPPAGAPLEHAAMTEVRSGFASEARYDPTAVFSRYRTFAFVEAPAGEPGAGSRVEQPVDRRIRRALGAELERKGFEPAPEGEADLWVGFGTGARSHSWYATPYPVWFDRWDAAGARVGAHVHTRGALVVDLADPREEKLVWHAWTSKGVDTVHDENALIAQAAAEVLAGFPPH